MLRPALAARFILVAVPASAGTVVKRPNGLWIDRDTFRLYPNGTVEAGKDATLVQPRQEGLIRVRDLRPWRVSCC